MHDEVQVVAGDALLPSLEAGPVAVVRVDPAPSSWAALKPRFLALRARARGGGRRVPLLEGYPACAIGSEFEELAAVRPPFPRFHAPCGPCGKRPVCSPPVAWSDELVPFSPAEPPLALWRRFHRRLHAVLGTPYREDLDALVAAHLAACADALAGRPLLLEPSLAFGDALLPAVRLGIFNGPLPAEPGWAWRAARALLASFAALHGALGVPEPRNLCDVLAAGPPVPFPLGFEATPGAPVLLKGYAQMFHLDGGARRTLGEALLALVDAGESERLPPFDWARVDMVGLGTSGGVLRALKLYVRRDPLAGWPDVGLPAVPAGAVLARLSGGRAYAVLDVRAAAPRPPKWDFALRHELLAGRLLVERLGPALPAPAQPALAALALAEDFRFDAVAAALRAGQVTIYGELG